MKLTLLEVLQVRNLARVSIRPDSRVNLFYGDNASGKTSLLEAIFLLSQGRSFRTRHLNNVTQSGKERFRLYAELESDTTHSTRIGLERRVTNTELRIDQQEVRQLSSLARRLPLLIMHPESHRLIEQGPSQRRKFLDWGMFHVEPNFHSSWKEYHRVLKQRNAALRRASRESEIEVWNKPLAEQAETITLQRQRYLEQLQPILQDFAGKLFSIDVALEYQTGWNRERSLPEALQRNLPGDRERGFTSSGPHRAELRMTCEGIPVQEKLSRGQKKLLVCAMLLAQSAHLRESTGKTPVILVDDLAAELDQAHRDRLLCLLQDTGAQIFITSTGKDLVPLRGWESYKVFHVEHGQVTEVV